MGNVHVNLGLRTSTRETDDRPDNPAYIP